MVSKTPKNIYRRGLPLCASFVQPPMHFSVDEAYSIAKMNEKKKIKVNFDTVSEILYTDRLSGLL